jgi:hypothetical protein
MKERPILFSTPMVKAIMEGRKTQTRRIIKNTCEHTVLDNHGLCRHCNHGTGYYLCRYGKPGDILWVRETWLSDERGSIDGKSKCIYYKTDLPDSSVWDGYWKPSIFLKKEDCRIKLLVKNVRIEKLNDISENDAGAEGIDWGLHFILNRPRFRNYYDKKNSSGAWYHNPVDSYKSLWESINGKGSWNLNPWVWVIEFEKLNHNA